MTSPCRIWHPQTLNGGVIRGDRVERLQQVTSSRNQSEQYEPDVKIVALRRASCSYPNTHATQSRGLPGRGSLVLGHGSPASRRLAGTERQERGLSHAIPRMLHGCVEIPCGLSKRTAGESDAGPVVIDRPGMWSRLHRGFPCSVADACYPVRVRCSYAAPGDSTTLSLEAATCCIQLRRVRRASCVGQAPDFSPLTHTALFGRSTDRQIDQSAERISSYSYICLLYTSDAADE